MENADTVSSAREADEMDFERFDGGGRSYTPQVTISEGGYISFNAGVCRRFGLYKFTHVILYFAPTSRIIGFEFTSEEQAEGARKLQRRDPSAGLYGKSFLDFYSVDRTRRQTFEPKIDEETGFLVVGPVDVVEVLLPNKTSDGEQRAGDDALVSADA